LDGCTTADIVDRALVGIDVFYFGPAHMWDFKEVDHGVATVAETDYAVAVIRVAGGFFSYVFPVEWFLSHAKIQFLGRVILSSSLW